MFSRERACTRVSTYGHFQALRHAKIRANSTCKLTKRGDNLGARITP